MLYKKLVYNAVGFLKYFLDKEAYFATGRGAFYAGIPGLIASIVFLALPSGVQQFLSGGLNEVVAANDIVLHSIGAGSVFGFFYKKHGFLKGIAGTVLVVYVLWEVYEFYSGFPISADFLKDFISNTIGVISFPIGELFVSKIPNTLNRLEKVERSLK